MPLQTPKRTYTLAELRLNKIQPEEFLAPTDSTLSGVRNVVQGGFLAGLTAAYFTQLLDLTQIVQVRSSSPLPSWCHMPHGVSLQLVLMQCNMCAMVWWPFPAGCGGHRLPADC